MDILLGNYNCFFSCDHKCRNFFKVAITFCKTIVIFPSNIYIYS